MAKHSTFVDEESSSSSFRRGVSMSESYDVESLLSTLYHALRASRRRYVIETLSESEDKILTTRELSRKIASLEQNLEPEQATGEPYRNVYNALSQTHLPTLSESGIIIYDSQRQSVLPGMNFDLAMLLLDTNTPMVGVISELKYYNRHKQNDTDINHS